MIVRDLITELLEHEMDAEVKLKILYSSTPDNRCYTADINSFGSLTSPCEILLNVDDFTNEDDQSKTLFDFIKDCKPTGDGTYEFPEYIKYYNERRKNDRRA